MTEPTEVWNVEQNLYDTRTAFVHIRNRCEEMIRNIDRILEEVKHDGNKAEKP